MPTTDGYGWNLPTVGGDSGSWGTELNTLVDDFIEAKIAAVETTAGAALPKAGGALTGEVEVKTERAALVDKGSVSGSQTFDLSAADFQVATISGDTTVSFSNWPTSGKAKVVTLELTNGGAHTITWPAAVKWDGGSAPTLQTSGVDVLVFYSRDNGTTIRGARSMSFSS